MGRICNRRHLVACVGALVIGGSTGSALAVDEVSTLDIAPSPSGYTIRGAEVGETSDGRVHLDLATDRETVIDIAPGDRLYAMSVEGSVIGQFNGPSADPTMVISPLSFVFEPSGDLVLAWRPVAGADVYEVQVEGALLSTVDKTTFRIAAAHVGIDDIVSVVAVSTTAPAYERVIGVMSLVVSDFHDLPDRTPTADRSAREVTAASLPAYTGFIFRSFIPDAWVEAPKLCDGQGAFPSDRFFKGDDRTFSSASTRFRTEATITLRWTQTSDVTTKKVGTTHLYRKNADGTYTFLESKNAGTSGMSFYGPNTYTSTRKNFISYTSVTNPFCATILTAAIDLTVNGVVDRTVGYTGFNIWGTHDRAPNYEFYFFNEGTSTTRFWGWNRSDFKCLNPLACTQVGFSIVK